MDSITFVHSKVRNIMEANKNKLITVEAKIGAPIKDV